MRTFPALLVCCWMLIASADERWDHRGSLGLLVGAEGEAITALGFGAAENGFVPRLALGGSLADGVNGNEFQALVRMGFARPRNEGSVLLNYRDFFGADRIKSFLDLGGSVQFAPLWRAGPRLGVGIQYELSGTVGLFGVLAVEMSAGSGFLIGAGLMGGLQLRSYLLE